VAVTDPFSPFSTTGLNPAASPTPATYAGSPALQGLQGPSSALGSAAPYHPDHPLFWVGAIILATFGLIGANSALRIGKFKASVNAGNV
jgi:hypothetical protein